MAIVTHFNQAPRKRGIALAGHGAKRAYVTTPLAGFSVASRKIPGVTSTANGETTHVPKVGAVLWLSDLEAGYELAHGTIVLMEPQPTSESAAEPSV
jgi:hypothetical protein